MGGEVSVVVEVAEQLGRSCAYLDSCFIVKGSHVSDGMLTVSCFRSHPPCSGAAIA